MSIDNNAVFDPYYQIHLISLLSRGVIKPKHLNPKVLQYVFTRLVIPLMEIRKNTRVHTMNPRDHPQQNGKIPSSQCI